ncbi:MAG: transporter substrate-binding domain-containing protein [Proteobacteria bacterium]|nr:transporter substrate-binding domain-containing protein [Pseudomonadota bacterium]
MKRIIIIFAALFLCAPFLWAETITISYFVSYPHIIFDPQTKKISGAVYDLIQDHIAPAMGDTFVWDNSPSPVPRQTMNLTEHKIDAVALLVFSPERAKSFRYSQKSYYQGKSAIAVTQDNPLTQINGLEDIMNMKIAYAKDTFITPFMRDERIQFDLVSDPNFLEMNIRKLLADRVQAVYSPDQAGLLYLITKMAAVDKIRVLQLPEKAALFHVVFSKGAEAKAARFDKAFDQINGSELYMKLLSKFFDTSRL